MLLFILAMVVLWFGCNNAAKEIVKEEAIYGRERAVNLGILPYLASKFLVLSADHHLPRLPADAADLRFAVPAGLVRHRPHSAPDRPEGHMLGYPAQFGVLALLAMTGVALGLLLSACVATPDRANALLPYVLIPQMILGGGFISVNAGALVLPGHDPVAGLLGLSGHPSGCQPAAGFRPRDTRTIRITPQSPARRC